MAAKAKQTGVHLEMPFVYEKRTPVVLGSNSDDKAYLLIRCGDKLLDSALDVFCSRKSIFK